MDAVTKKNTVLYSAKEAIFASSIPMLSGSLMQLFLAHKGMSSSSIGLFSTVISIVMTLSTILLSSVAERKPNPIRQSNRLIVWISLGFLLLLPATLLDIDRRYLTLIITVIVSVLTVLQATKSILEYKVPYQIMDMNHYGTMCSISAALIGIIGILSGFLFSWIIEAELFGNPYLVCMILALVMMVLARVFSFGISITNHSFDQVSEKKSSSFRETISVLTSRDFTLFLVPNALRGITLGITGSMTLIALAMGLSEADASKLTIMMSLSQIAASIFYFFLIKKLKVDIIGLIGSILLCLIVFLPMNNTPMFLTLVVITIMGRVLVDNTVPIMCFHIINPETAGTYHAWRCILNNLVSAGTVYLTGVLLETMHPIVLLIPCALAYLICMIWYTYFYRKICKEKNIKINS